MKKFLIGLMIVLSYVQVGFAGCNTDRTLTFKANQKPEHDEFLYLTKYQYDASVEGYKNTKKQNSGSGKAYECDRYHSSGCSVGETVTMPAGHVFQGTLINNEQKYQCVKVAFNDKWVAVGDCNCCNSLQFGDIPIGGAYSRNLSKAECSSYNKTDETHGTSFQLRCQENRNLLCWAVACDDPNMTPDSNGVCVVKKEPSDGTCTAVIRGQTVTLNRGAESPIDLTASECSSAVPSAHGGGTMDPNGIFHFFCGPTCKFVGCQKGYSPGGNNTCVKNNPPKPGDKTCRERHAKEGLKRLACCDVEDAGTGYWQNGDCYCNNRSADFKIINNDFGQCVPKEFIVPPSLNCPPDATPSEDGKTCACNDENMTYDGKECRCTVVDKTEKKGGKCVCVDSDKEIKNGKCEWTAAYVAKLEAELNSKYESLGATMGRFEKNVWRDEDGNFNTARLASDSVAGVVLGTVGGIVTANLVKKSQVKKGFEDIGCYIGGQSVAGFGDEFTVGR